MTQQKLSIAWGKPKIFYRKLLGKPGEWLTWNYIHQHGGSVKKGAKSGLITFWKTYVAGRDEDETAEEEKDGKAPEKRWVLRYYRAYHIEDVVGIESKLAKIAKADRQVEPIDAADKVVQGYIGRNRPLRLEVEASNRACYSPSRDVVTVPLLEQFDLPEPERRGVSRCQSAPLDALTFRPRSTVTAPGSTLRSESSSETR